MNTVLIRGQVPDMLKRIYAKRLPAVGEDVQIVVEKTGHFCGLGRVVRIDPQASTYDVDTKFMHDTPGHSGNGRQL